LGKEYSVKLGRLCQHRFTPFKGIAVLRTTYSNGCVSYLLQPTEANQKGERIKPQSFDVQDIYAVSANEVMEQTAKPMIKMGTEVRDKISGWFTGTVTAITELLGAAPEYAVQPHQLTDDGEPASAVFFLETRLEAIDQIIKPVKEKKEPKKRPGGPERPFGGPENRMR
jgi:hypothetical protein